ncbi:DNA repair protein rad52 [Coniothyrium glycines]
MPAPGDQYHGGNVKNPFEERVVNGFTATEIATLQSRLNKQLGPEYISQRPGNGGGKVAYLEGNKAIALANEVFGFNGWSSSLGQVQIDYVDELPGGKVSLGLSIVVRITLKDGTYHEDIGYGSIENGKGKAASFEKAKKEAATDGLKRALRTFGNVLGNCLYDKEYLKKVQAMKVKRPEFQEDSLYRHSAFALPPKEDQAIVKREPQRTPHRPNQVLRTRTDHLSESFGADFDDEADENLFDGVDGTESHGDGRSFESDAVGPKAIGPPRPNDVPSARTSPVRKIGPTHQPNPRIQPGPVSHGQAAPQQPQSVQSNGRSQQNVSNERQPQTPVHQHNQSRSAHQSGRVGPNNGSGGPGSRPPAQHQQKHQPHTHNQPLRPTPPQAQHPPDQVRTPAPVQAIVAPAANAPSNGHPTIGFVSSRGLNGVQVAADVPSFTGLPAFNPQVESPIPVDKRTPGVNHGRSAPIKRDAVGVPPAPAPPQTAAGRPAPPATSGNFNRPNLVNPHLDANRRIGMPGAPSYAMSPSANRGAYKPPTFSNGGGPQNGVKRERPALQDVSNVGTNGASTEGPDAKKQKVETPGSENAPAFSTT